MSSTTLIKNITLAVFIVVACNIGWWFVSEIAASIESERIAREGGFTVTHCTFGPPIEFVSRVHILIFFIASLVGSRLKGLSNTLLNVIGLTGAVVTYIFWWQYYFLIMEVSGAGPGAIKNFAYLVGGNVFDIAIAAFIGLLVLLNIRDAALSSFRLNIED